jgi:beta-xylosidase
LIRKLVQHWVDRYGLDEVWYWFFEVWSEQIWRPSAAADKTNFAARRASGRRRGG